MTFQRWARLLIGVLRGDDFIASTVKADSKGEAARRRSRPAIWKLTIYRPCHLRTNTITRTVTVSLASKIQSSRSVTLQMKCIITTDTMPCLLTQCRGEVRWISLPPLVTFSSGWATPSNWFHPLTHTWVSHGYHQQTSAPPPPPNERGCKKPTLSPTTPGWFCQARFKQRNATLWKDSWLLGPIPRSSSTDALGWCPTRAVSGWDSTSAFFLQEVAFCCILLTSINMSHIQSNLELF